MHRLRIIPNLKIEFASGGFGVRIPAAKDLSHKNRQ